MTHEHISHIWTYVGVERTGDSYVPKTPEWSNRSPTEKQRIANLIGKTVEELDEEFAKPIPRITLRGWVP